MKKTRNLLALAMVGALLIGATSASSTTVTHNPDAGVSYTLNGNEDFTAGTITISDGTTTITMLDRNLGATKAGTGCEDPNGNCQAYAKYYGYHFQWGNNYGFYPDNIAVISPNQLQAPISYHPFYTEGVFRIGHKNWLSDNGVADLWGGDLDDNTYNLNDDTWKIKKNPRKRQGPCPEGFHVPSRGELDKIKDMMGNDINAIHNELLIPYAGYTDYNDAHAKDLGKDAHLWSSSPHALNNPHSRMLDLVFGAAIVGSDYRAHGYSIRCVYDQYDNYTSSTTVTTVTHNPDAGVSYTLNGNEDFTAGTITISDGTTTITMLDRNLGATKAGTGCEDPNGNCQAYAKYYGYHFQWGNNYGFYPNNIAVISPNQLQAPISYHPFYTEGVFRIGHKNWLSDNGVADLWGGDLDDNTYDLNDDTWKIKKNPRKRQGPCPEGFHVPSRGELDKIKDMMGNDINAIHNELLIPFAGYTDYNDAHAKDLGKDAHLWSSSPHALNNPHSRMLDLVFGAAIVGSDYRAHGYSIRCVYDQYDNYTSSTTVTTVTHNPDAGVSYTLNGNEDFTAGTITISDGTTTITMLDRNLGATKAGTGCEDPNGNCQAYAKYYGYHFQWGNNYGFYPNNIAVISPNQLQAPISYHPFYTEGVFRIGHKNWLSDNGVADLWGGDLDDNTYDLNDDTWKIKKNPRKRQGPCPEGFHVPSRGELDKIKDMMGNDINAIHNELLIPFAGYTDYNDAHAKDLGKDAHLWSSSPHALNNPHSRMLDLVFGAAIVGSDYRAHGYSIRCVYDQYESYSSTLSLPGKVEKRTITFVDGSGIEKSIVWEGEYGTKTNGKIDYPKRTKTGYTLSWHKKIPDTVPEENIVIIAIWTKKLTTNNGGQQTFKNGGLDTVKILPKDKTNNSTKDCINGKCTDNNLIQKAHNSSALFLEDTTESDKNLSKKMDIKQKNNITTTESDINSGLVKTAIVNSVNILWKNVIQPKHVNLITGEMYQINKK